jgi:hypothetical protein
MKQTVLLRLYDGLPHLIEMLARIPARTSRFGSRHACNTPLDISVRPCLHMLVIATLAIAASSPQRASAAVINIDLQPFEGAPPVMNGQAAYPGDAGSWNNVNDQNSGFANGPGHAVPVALADSSGAATDVTFTIASAGGFNDQGVQALVASPTDLMRDYVYDGAFVGQLGMYVFNGLVPNAAYDLYLYGSNVTGNAGALFTIDGVSQGTTGSQTASRSISLGEDYVVFNRVLASGTGQFVIQHGDNPAHSNGTTPFNGLQLIGPVASPEPPAFKLGLLGVIGFMAWRHAFKSRSTSLVARYSRHS